MMKKRLFLPVLLIFALTFFLSLGVYLLHHSISTFISSKIIFLQGIPLLTGLLAYFVCRKEAWAGNLEDGLRRFFNRPRLFLLGASILMFGYLIWVNRIILQRFMNSGDEFSCYFFARCLLAGKFWAVPHPLKEFFEVTHVGAVGDQWFSVYPPGWPIVWALAIKMHLKDLINPLFTATAYGGFLFAGMKIYGKGTAFLAGVFLFISPFFVMTGSAYNSHAVCLLLLLFFYASVWKWITTKVWGWGSLGGFFLGAALGTRYLTSAAMAFPVCIYLLHLFWTKKMKWGKGAVSFILIFCFLNLLHAYYNFAVTGSFLDAPNHYLHPHERLGFIPGYTPLTALRYLWERILYLMSWTAPLLVPAFFAGLFSRPKNTADLLLRGSVISLTIAYMFYYSWGGNQYGPRYYWEAFPLFCLLAAYTFRKIWISSSRKITAGILLGTVAASFPVNAQHFSFFQKATRERQAVYRVAEEKAQKPALIFLKGFLGDSLVLSPEDSVRNDPFLNQPIVYAKDLGEKNKDLLPYFPQRHVYTAYYDRPKLMPVLTEGWMDEA